MTLGELLTLIQMQRTGPIVPMSAAGVPLGSRPMTLQERVNGARVPNPAPSTLPPPWIGVRG